MDKIFLSDEQMKAVPRAAPGTVVRELSSDVVARIRLNDEQTRLLLQALSSVQICDPQGTVLGTAEPEQFPEFIAEMKRRAASPGPRYTGKQIQARLRALQEEWDRTGGFDKAYMEQFLAKLNAADPGDMR